MNLAIAIILVAGAMSQTVRVAAVDLSCGAFVAVSISNAVMVFVAGMKFSQFMREDRN